MLLAVSKNYDNSKMKSKPVYFHKGKHNINNNMHMTLQTDRTGMFIQLHRASDRYSSYVKITAV